MFKIKVNLFSRIKLISKKIKKEDELRNRMANKFTNFIENNGKIPNNGFYIENFAHVQLFGKFVDYLCVIRKLYSTENKIYKMMTNFIDYSENLIDIAIKNINVYDLYHFNKETLIYSYCNEEKKRFLSSKFKRN